MVQFIAIWATYRLSRIHNTIRLGDADAEDPEEDIPEIKSELVTNMREDVGSAVAFVDLALGVVDA